jgi:hypothetical protein
LGGCENNEGGSSCITHIREEHSAFTAIRSLGTLQHVQGG